MTRLVALVAFLVCAATASASPNEAIAVALQDAKRLPQALAYETRYLYLGQGTAAGLETDRLALTYHLNQISRNGALVAPRVVREDLVAVFLPDYDPDLKTWPKLWDRLARFDPYFHYQRYEGSTYYPEVSPYHNEAAHKELLDITYSYAPFLRADWFVVTTCRQIDLNDRDNGVGYYDFLAIKNRADYEKLVGLQAKETIERRRDVRAALNRSGVSQHNRQVEILKGFHGWVYKTLDSKSNVDGFDKEKKKFRLQNAIEHLKRGEFDHDAEEHYGFLPNGLFVYLLCDAEGKLQPSAPDFIGIDKSPLNDTTDTRIHVCIACIRCHIDGIRPIDCWARRTVRSPLGFGAKKYQDLADLTRQYGGDLEEEDGIIKTDRRFFARNVKAITGWTIQDNAAAFARYYSAYTMTPRGLEQAAQEIGVSQKTVLVALQEFQTAVQEGREKRKPLPQTVTGLLQDPPEPLRVEHWEEFYQRVVGIVVRYQREQVSLPKDLP